MSLPLLGHSDTQGTNPGHERLFTTACSGKSDDRRSRWLLDSVVLVEPARRNDMANRELQLVRCTALAAALAVCIGSGAPAQAGERDAGRWTATWATGPAGPSPGPVPSFQDQTLRYIVHVSIGGVRVRVKLSNTFGTDPVVIGSARVARRVTVARIDPRTSRRLTFSGVDHVTIPVGALVVSDPVDLDVSALSDLAVSIYLPQPTAATTMHALALQTNYIAAGTGDSTRAVDLPGAATTASWHFLTGVAVL